MGAGASASTYTAAGEEAAEAALTSATATADQMGAEGDTKTAVTVQLGALATFQSMVAEFQTDDDGNPDPYNPKFPGDAQALLKAEGADKKLVGEALSYWNCYRLMNGCQILAANHAAIFKLYEDLGPDPKKEQLTRKGLLTKLTEAGVMAANIKAKHGDKATDAAIANALKGYVNTLMQGIGKEKAQAALSEDDYGRIVKKLVVAESGDEANWNNDMWTIVDKTKCPDMVKIKADLDKLDTKGEFGINRHEWRLFFMELGATQGEPAVKKQLEGIRKEFGLE